MTLQAKNHVIRAGENLSVIAQKYGLPSWKVIYYAPSNAAFRRAHKDPDLVYPGMTVGIPATAQEQRQALETRLQRLMKVKTEAQEIFRQEEKVLNGDLRSIKGTASAVDMIATVALIFVDLTKLTKEAHRIMQLSDEAAEAASQKFAKDVLKGRATNVRDAAAQAVSGYKRESTNPVWLATKSVAQAWCDMTSPSFWANTIVNVSAGMSWGDAVATRPEDVHQRAMASLRQTAQKVQGNLDAKIQETRAELSRVSAAGATRLP